MRIFLCHFQFVQNCQTFEEQMLVKLEVAAWSRCDDFEGSVVGTSQRFVVDELNLRAAHGVLLLVQIFAELPL